MDNENINIDDDELEIREEEETEEDIEAVIEDDDEDESEDAELDEDGDGAETADEDDANEDPAEDGAALTEKPRQQTDAGNEKKTDEAEIERLKRELAEKEKIIEQKNKALRFVGYDENNSEALASGFDGTQQEKGDAARYAAEFAREKRQADYDLVVMKYPWAANEAKSVDGFGEKFMRVMQYNEDKMTALDAFEVSHAQEIDEHRHKQTVSADIRAAERRAVRNMSNKEHQKGVGKSGGGNAVTIPKAVYEQYRAFNPDVTDKEIARHYSKDKKK